MVIDDILPDHSQMLKRKQLVLVGKKIRELRKNAGFSQEKFAADAGLERSYYGRIERGEHNATTLTLIKIADTLSLELVALFPRMEELRRAKKK